MRFIDKRLPDGVTIWLNDFDEYVAVKYNKVAQVQKDNKCTNVRASKTLEGSIQNYLKKDTNTSTLN